MTGRILVGYDGRPQSRDALALAELIAKPTGMRLVLAWIETVGPLDLPFETIFQPIQDKAEAALRRVAEQVRERGIEVETRVGLLGSAWHGLAELATAESAALLVVGSSHHGRVGRVLAGSVGRQLLHGSPCPVAVAPCGFSETGPPTFARIGVGYDGSPEAQLALSWAEQFARAAGATLRLLVVSEDRSFDLADAARATLRRAERILADGLDRVTEVRASGVVKSGLTSARLTALSADVDLLVVGSRGYGPLRRVLLGSVAGRLVDQSHAPVVVTPRVAVEHRDRIPAGAVST